MSVRSIPSALVVAAVASLVMSPGAWAGIVVQTYWIDVDTPMDSWSPTFNYGASTTDKVVVNGSNGSLVRALFELPASAWTIPPDQGLFSAKIYFYTWQNSTGSRTVELHPLTRSFVEGTGAGTLSGDGATWQTCDGTTPWTTAGGDYDAATFVRATESANWFVWDITALWNNADLRSHGALLRMDDESNPGASSMPRAPFTSAEGATNERPYIEVSYVPEPASLTLLGLVGLLAAQTRRGLR
jgi:hypothetical protein